jgi:murein DD-endopeptidase MepM/ murein hydrolase activator NlpD
MERLYHYTALLVALAFLVFNAPNRASACDAPQSTASIPEEMDAPHFIWPVKGRLVQSFCARREMNGIDIAARRGTRVKAAADGVVAYAGRDLKAFGRLILIRHPDGWVTAYAHNRKFLVKRDQKVRQGQSIARVGQSGGATFPKLHFEIRKASEPLDPIRYLPKS